MNKYAIQSRDSKVLLAIAIHSNLTFEEHLK